MKNRAKHDASGPKALDVKQSAENNRMRNIYKRILNPSGESYKFRVVECSQEHKHLLHRRLIADTRGKYTPRAPPKWQQRPGLSNRRVRIVTPGEAGRGAAPSLGLRRREPIKTKSPEISEEPLAQHGADEQVTLIPVHVKDIRHRYKNVDERDRTRVSYRLGLSPTPIGGVPTGPTSPDGEPAKGRHSVSPRRKYHGYAKDNHNAFIHVHNKKEPWRRAPKGTEHKQENDLRLESACGGESPSPAVSGTATDSLLRNQLRQERQDRRGRLSQAKMREYEPELTTSELLSQLKCWPKIKRLLE